MASARPERKRGGCIASICESLGLVGGDWGFGGPGGGGSTAGVEFRGLDGVVFSKASECFFVKGELGLRPKTTSFALLSDEPDSTSDDGARTQGWAHSDA